MSETDVIAIAGFTVLFGLMALRVPVGIAMGVVGVGGFAQIAGWGPALNQLAISPLRVITDYNTSLIPMFILMGVFATRSGISAELFGAARAWVGHLRGGLGLATISACAGFAAISGSSVATAATMSRVALPQMRKAGYRDELATGVIASGGTLGILIPPSVVLAVYGYITQQDIGTLFIAGVVPGALAVGMYLAVVWLIAGKQADRGQRLTLRARCGALRGIWAVMVLFVAVIGGIYAGVVTPTEAAAAGAFLTGLIGVLRGRLNMQGLRICLVEALRTAVSIYTILIGAMLFSYFLAITQTPQKITAWLTDLDLGAYPTLGLILMFFLIMGCILDAMAMIILLVPIVYPVVVALGFDPIWFGIIVVMTVELGMITPPIGMNVYVINAVIRDAKLITIFRGVMPFVAVDLLRLVVLALIPAITLWLPNTMN
ncbi:C4-dicarboxylate ABC transporter permease [Thioclava sp. SK-1]|uniref:TRAP transporter large permease n=1 Tax=Thioclava sp. SK-1 TaxID=1889770 RepID=UPI0008269868|nr:TRAP transporter large permease [Thioclava sp. SK-1]OCX64448.1 C4-dicarboxylate ABC transporter permease [Thioclava sp. SK-1]